MSWTSVVLGAITLASVVSALTCDLGVVGAGPGGAYAAWRAAADGRSVCIFERRSRPGGRIHSLRGQGPRKDLVVEAGGYRFAPKPVVEKTSSFEWKIDTPLTAAIIKELGLPTVPYNPNASDWDHGMHKLVDTKGHDVGYLTFIERMLELAVSHGAKLVYNTAITSLDTTQDNIVLRHSSGECVARSVLLNLPQKPLVELLRNSGHSIASQYPEPLYNPVSFPIMKLYVHYDDAWWRNDLGLVAGPFYNTEPQPPPGQAHMTGVPTGYPVPLEGQYHDGDVRCDLPGGACRGFLQAFYGGDTSHNADGVNGAIKFFDPIVDSIREDAAVHIDRVAPQHLTLLDALHKSLVDLHRVALDAVNATAKVTAMKPTGAVMSIWSQGVVGINAGCHGPKRGTAGGPAVPGALSKAALQPLHGLPIFVANEAYGTMQCFAEGSLAMAESALKGMNVSLPRSGWLSHDLRNNLLERETSEHRPPSDPFLLHHHVGQQAVQSSTASVAQFRI